MILKFITANLMEENKMSKFAIRSEALCWTRERVNHSNQIDSLNKENDCKWIVWTATDLKKIFNVEVRFARKVNFQALHWNTVTEDSLE